jgi:cAMP-dependent protein kinase regulator
MSTFRTNPFGGSEDKGPSGGIGKVVEEDENDTLTSPTTASFGQFAAGASPFGGSFGGDGAGGGPPSSWRPAAGEGFPSNYGMNRRTSVSAESLNPTAASNENWTPPFHKKTSDQLERLRTAIAGNLLFNKLADEQSEQVLGALVEKHIPAKDIKVCT